MTNRSRLERLTSTVFAGVIVLFMSDETLLTVIEWALAWMLGVILIALPLAFAVRQCLLKNVLSPSGMLQEIVGERHRSEALLPARCPIRSISHGICTEPPDRIRLRADAGLRGWQSDSR